MSASTDDSDVFDRSIEHNQSESTNNSAVSSSTGEHSSLSDYKLVAKDSISQDNNVIHKQMQRKIFKIIVIGDSNVGKTCLTYRFCSGKFPDKTEATIGVDFRERTIEINNCIVKLQLWDTAGQERFRKSMVQHYYRNVHAVVFVYDVTKLSSFESMPGWIEECDRHSLTSRIPRILVGNKCDMSERVAVNTNMAQKFADSHSMPLFETSAKDDEKANHIDSIFMTLAHKLQHSRPMMSSRSSQDSDQSQSVITIGRHPSFHGLQPGPPGGSNDAKSCAC